MSLTIALESLWNSARMYSSCPTAVCRKWRASTSRATSSFAAITPWLPNPPILQGASVNWVIGNKPMAKTSFRNWNHLKSNDNCTVYIVEFRRLRRCEVLIWGRGWGGEGTGPITRCLSTAWSSITTSTCKACSTGRRLCATSITLTYLQALCKIKNCIFSVDCIY